MSTAICKFYVESVTQRDGGALEKGGRAIIEDICLRPEMDASLPENKKFTNYTPLGYMEFTTTNPNLIGVFKPQQRYYVKLVEVE